MSGGALIVAGGANFPEGYPWDGGKKIYHDRIFVLEKPDGDWRVAEQRLPKPVAYGVSVTVPGRDSVVCIGGNDATQCYQDVFLLAWDPQTEKIVSSKYPPLPKPCAIS